MPYLAMTGGTKNTCRRRWLKVERVNLHRMARNWPPRDDFLAPGAKYVRTVTHFSTYCTVEVEVRLPVATVGAPWCWELARNLTLTFRTLYVLQYAWEHGNFRKSHKNGPSASAVRRTPLN